MRKIGKNIPCEGLIALLLLVICAASPAEAAPHRYTYHDDSAILQKEMRDSISEMRHELNNHESEIRTFEAKIANQELIIDSLRKQLNEANQSSRAAIESELKTLKAQLADQQAAANEYKKRISQLESIAELQTQNQDSLQAAIKAILDSMQGKDEAVSDKYYRVKPGDTLGEIAKKHNTSVKRLKELNNLPADQIIVGKKLQVLD